MFLLTLYIKIGTCVDSRTQSILRRTPVLSRFTLIRRQTQSFPMRHSRTILDPHYLWGWVTGCITGKRYVISLYDSFVRRFYGEAWRIYKRRG